MIQIIPLPGIPLIQPGDELPLIITEALRHADLSLQSGDVLVITSKIVSKAEGRQLDLRTVNPSSRAYEIAAATGKDPRLVEVALGESQEIARMRMGVMITRHKLGFVSANAGIDHSNVGPGGEDWILLLPRDPDGSAVHLRDQIGAITGVHPAVIISDTHGRPHRLGNVGVAIGVSGIPALLDLRGRGDLFGRKLQYTDIGLADELAAAADLVSGQAAEGLPVTLIRGYHLPSGAAEDGRAADLYRPLGMDLFR
ncbi:MAG: coenzyme F420-0:L-glutamate ligase [Anaerolinea sp.]|nr:coenzyme F420-0:L-glutamate ligase [Anaerolinea sp.]MCC6975112.1 coenzyme F420-0:L-glutamate ligase [Anaerolineae bacterium]CAG1015347.1 coenzyme F420-0:L-glutamate ligase / coenzyme F420-1:gamma-L-glutamate ligase [Anaerolineae bacterium]